MPRRMRSGDVSLFEAIRSYSDMSATSFLVGLACFIALADVGCAVALYGVVHDWAPGSWGPLVILKNTWGGQVWVWVWGCVVARSIGGVWAVGQRLLAAVSWLGLGDVDANLLQGAFWRCCCLRGWSNDP